jgi:hypothetical protein
MSSLNFSTSLASTSAPRSSVIATSFPSTSFLFGRNFTATRFSHPPLQATVFQVSQVHPRFAHSTSPMASGFEVHFFTSANVFSLCRNCSWLYGWKFGCLRGVDAFGAIDLPTALTVPSRRGVSSWSFRACMRA